MADGLIEGRPGGARAAVTEVVAEAPETPLWLRAAAILRSSPWWVRVLGIFAASRVFSTALLLVFARIQANNPWTLAHPDYLSYARIWDGQWYYIVAQVGYPTTLPLNEAGQVAQNAWAFLPVYPMLVKGLGVLTGAAFAPLAVFVSVAAAVGASLVFFRIVTRFAPNRTAYFAVLLFCVAPTSPLLQVAYAESLFLFLLALALLLLLQRRYRLLLGVLAVAAFTRPGVIAFALALALHWGWRWWTRSRDPFPVRDRVTVGVVAVVTGVLGFAWPIVAALATGDLHAYTETELAWRSDYIGRGALLPFSPWIQGANWWFPGGSGILFLCVALVLFALFLLSPWSRRLPIDLRFWVVSYALYLLAVFFPQSSTFRILMPVFPLLAAMAMPRPRAVKVLLVLGGLAGQVVWMYYCWFVNGYDWTPP